MSNCSNNNLIDLEGIEEFKNLERLICYNSKLTELPDLSKCKNLKELKCFVWIIYNYFLL